MFFYIPTFLFRLSRIIQKKNQEQPESVKPVTLHRTGKTNAGMYFRTLKPYPEVTYGDTFHFAFHFPAKLGMSYPDQLSQPNSKRTRLID